MIYFARTEERTSQISEGGFVVVRTFSPRGYVKKDKNLGDAVLPEIFIIDAREKPIEVRRRAIHVGEARNFNFCFSPVWNNHHLENLEKYFVFSFPKAFIPAEGDDSGLGDFAAYGADMTGKWGMWQGDILYSRAGNRDLIIQGSKENIRAILFAFTMKFPPGLYDLGKTGQTRHYRIRTLGLEAQRFTEAAMNKLESFLSC